ncbi:MTH1187 family thiamine-binding protein [Desulfovibrio inopinatus]|uniref:MTH1187 family thiamine-binding protein n=1 Tax=Desulfovibrio inopinatus TaxID=102109 RepID=UPI0004157E22|nr:MTH1187 family thiamine-binding protein [Desulfovibrio inopinatus]
MSAIVEFSIFPIDKGINLSSHVAKAVAIVKNSGVTYQFTPMGTIMEGDLGTLLDIVKECHDTMRQESDRVYINLKVDSRTGDSSRLEQKIRSVETKIK